MPRSEVIATAVAFHTFVCRHPDEEYRWTYLHLRNRAFDDDEHRLRGRDEPPSTKWYEPAGWTIDPAINLLIAGGVLISYPDPLGGECYGPGPNVDTWQPPAPESEERGGQAVEGVGPARGRKVPSDWLGKAMILVNENPEWTDCKIAGQVGRTPSTLSKSKQYQHAAEIARSTREVRRGHKTADGSIESYVE